MEWVEQQIGLAKLLLAIAVAACASLLVWAVQNRQTESATFVWLAWVFVVVSGVFAVVILNWALAGVRRLKLEEEDDGTD